MCLVLVLFFGFIAVLRLRPSSSIQVYDSFFSSRRMVGMVASLEVVQLTWRVLLEGGGGGGAFVLAGGGCIYLQPFPHFACGA